MERSKKQWDELVTKYRYGINPTELTDATNEDLDNYVDTFIRINDSIGFTDDSLWHCYREKFEDFTVETFKKMSQEAIIKLRDYLLSHGVYIAPPKYTPLAKGYNQCLFDTQDEIDRIHAKVTKILTQMPQDEVNWRKRKAIELTLKSTPSNMDPLSVASNSSVSLVLPPASQEPQIPQESLPPRAATSISTYVAPTPTHYRAEIASVAKLYTEEQKYGGGDDSFEYKSTIFVDICSRSGLPDVGYMAAFPTMLKGIALSHYYSSNLGGRSYENACTHMSNFFEGDEFKSLKVEQWNNTTLKGMMGLTANAGKSIYEVFRLLVEELSILRYSIYEYMRTDVLFRDNIKTACGGHEACRIGLLKPVKDIGEYINGIRSSISTWEKDNPHRTENTYLTDGNHPFTDRNPRETYYTDRKYHRKDENYRPSAGYQDNSQSRQFQGKHGSRSRSTANSKCYSNFRQYVILCEGDDEDKGEDLIGTFESMILGRGAPGFEESDDDCFFTFSGALDSDLAISMSVELANRACSHNIEPSLSMPTYSEPLLERPIQFSEVNPCQYNSNANESRYSSFEFIGVMIDTVASSKSTAGYEHFQALQKERRHYKKWRDSSFELQRLHRRFGHPSVARLQKLLYNAGERDIDREALEKLEKFCHHCQLHGNSPGRFRFALREQDDVDFNYNIIIDVMYINNLPVLHVVDEATRFQAARWLKDISTKETWDALRACWMDTYLGPPDQITHDAGKTSIIKAELPELDRTMALQMALKALNDSVGPSGLVPTLLVFGAYPRLVEPSPPSPSITQRAAAIKRAMDEIRKRHSERLVADARNMRNGPNTDALHELPPG
ncbi:hypothetical protein BJ878DRAFT_479973 [Calycina marina]|uniref:Uncharacterized protein n=1 Tax=Calycina marina TaxID=1763456 RepID=A0A9P7Z3C5_9HELO|nr:hypothetical protein BJ878DRAFT_479973 [Calycina marina]